jgi:hypothetical protein
VAGAASSALRARFPAAIFHPPDTAVQPARVTRPARGARAIVSTRGQMIATVPLRECLFECPHYGRHGFDYWQQLKDGRIAVVASPT